MSTRSRSAMKYKRQSDLARSRNRALKSTIHTFSKKAVQAAEAGDMDAARAFQRIAQSTIDKAAKGSTLHANTASRKKSRLAQHIKRIDIARQTA